MADDNLAGAGDTQLIALNPDDSPPANDVEDDDETQNLNGEPVTEKRGRGLSAAEMAGPSTLFSHPVGTDQPPQTTISEETASEIEAKTEPTWWDNNEDRIYLIGKIVFLLFIISYSLAAFIIDFERALALFVIEVIIIAILLTRFLYRRYLKGVPTRIIDSITRYTWAKWVICGLLVVGVIVAVVLCTYQDPGRLVAAGGLAVFIGGCWLFSWNRKAIKWRPVLWGFGLQFTFGLIILRTQPGFELFQWLGDAFKVLLDFTFYGSQFVFGYLATGQYSYPEGDQPFAFASVFAFSVIPTVIFFSSLVSVLYYLGVLQVLIYYLSILMQYTLGTSSSESLNAAGNIFVGMTEAPLLIKPFLKDMTRSELHAVMTGGFATIAGGVMAIYIFFGVPAAHLLSASVMSAPAALAISKIVYPEDEISPTAQNKKEGDDEEDDAAKVLKQIGTGNETNVVEAAANGAAVAIGLAANICGMLIAFLALINMLNYLFSWWGSLINWDITFIKLMGYIFYPFSILMGIHPKDAQIAGELIGTKVVVNEFVAYVDLVDNVYAEGGSTISLRSEVILIYALCGFSNLGSIGITLGGLTPLAPERKKDLTQLVVSAMIAGNIACFMTACIAALLFDPDRY